MLIMGIKVFLRKIWGDSLFSKRLRKNVEKIYENTLASRKAAPRKILQIKMVYQFYFYLSNWAAKSHLHCVPKKHVTTFLMIS